MVIVCRVVMMADVLFFQVRTAAYRRGVCRSVHLFASTRPLTTSRPLHLLALTLLLEAEGPRLQTDNSHTSSQMPFSIPHKKSVDSPMIVPIPFNSIQSLFVLLCSCYTHYTQIRNNTYNLEFIYYFTYFSPSSHPAVVCFFPVGPSLLIQHFQLQLSTVQARRQKKLQHPQYLLKMLL